MSSEPRRHTAKQSPAREHEETPNPDSVLHDDSEVVISLLLAGKSLPEVQATLKVSRSTLWRLRQSDAFRLKYAAAKDALLAGAVDRLHVFAADFVTSLHSIAVDEKVNPNARASAAREGLAALFRSKELMDLSERISKLEYLSSEDEE